VNGTNVASCSVIFTPYYYRMHQRFFIYFFILGFFVSGIHVSNAQKTKVMGLVTDFDTEEPLPFVNIAFRGTSIGTTTDFDGKFSLETAEKVDSLLAYIVFF